MPKFIRACLISFLFAFTLSGCTLVGGENAALQVSSKPEASVFLNEKHIGKTPFYSDQLKPGEYSLKVTAGEAVYLEKINLNPKALTVVNRNLNDNSFNQEGETLWLENGNGELFIHSQPDNSKIVINGRDYGVTPKVISDLEEGDHKVLISKEGFKDREFSVKASSNTRVIANVKLASSDSSSAAPPIAANEEPKLTILSTPQGFLRVRREPDLEAIEVGRVETGEEFEIIQETDDWYKISFDGKLGWISRQYARVIE